MEKQVETGGEKKTAAKKSTKPRPPKVKDYAKTKEYREVRDALISAVASRQELDPLSLDRISEYMDMWCQRRILRDDVLKRGPIVCDERGRKSENRNISLGLQTSKQMLEIYKALGFDATPARRSGGSDANTGGDETAYEDDDL